MSPDETMTVLAHMAGAWPKPVLTPEQVEVWVTHMADVDSGLATTAALELEAEEEFFPRIVRFRSKCADVARRRASERGIGTGEAPRVCQLCDGTGWMLEPTAVPDSVRRCRCRPVPMNHPSGCSCTDCAYGPERADRIRTGRDGNDHTGVDSLKRIRVSESAWTAVSTDPIRRPA